MRKLRKMLEIGLPILGVVIVVNAVLLLHGSRFQMVGVLAGIVLIVAGVWRLAEQLLPNERRFHALRHELNEFLVLCRQLNQAAVALKADGAGEHHHTVADLRERLHDAVERMAEVAGEPGESPVPTGRDRPTHVE